jgi:hypothetical protein
MSKIRQVHWKRDQMKQCPGALGPYQGSLSDQFPVPAKSPFSRNRRELEDHTHGHSTRKFTIPTNMPAELLLPGRVHWNTCYWASFTSTSLVSPLSATIFEGQPLKNNTATHAGSQSKPIKVVRRNISSNRKQNMKSRMHL